MNTSALFITYDGLLDPLGGSQILPYLRGIASHPRQVYILSFEKPERFSASGASLQQKLAAEGIEWMPLPFSHGAAGKSWDLLRMHIATLRLVVRNKIGILHCRGHLAAQVGTLVKRLTGARVLFDFRGLWVDERVDKGSWNLDRWLDRATYHSFKWLERRMLRSSDHVVVLTQAVVPVVASLGATSERITVVPCCADFDHFTLTSPDRRRAAKQHFGLPEDRPILGYLGSAGPMYMFDKFLEFCETAVAQGQASAVLCISPDRDYIHSLMERHGWLRKDSRFQVVSATRDQVPNMLAAVDLLVSFVLPTPARISMSPTKMAECFAQGIPMVTNPGIGDVELTINDLGAGVVFDPADVDTMHRLAGDIASLVALGGNRLRREARPLLGLEVAHKRYACVYEILEKTC